MSDLEAGIRALVRERLGCEPLRVADLPGALGTRRFARVWLPDSARMEVSTLIARVEAAEDPQRRPAGVPAEPPLEPIRALLAHHGLPVPRRFAHDRDAGIELLEDFGDRALAELAPAAEPDEREDWYRQACTLVPRLQNIAPVDGVAAFERRLDAAHFTYKAERFASWSLCDASTAQVKVVREAFARIAEAAQCAPQRLAHRDFQSANLFVVDGRIAMIDLQGALMAPPEYDLVCLLCDSYVELDAAFVAKRLAEVRDELPDAPDAESFERRFDLLTLSRKGKDHALYHYAAAELGDPRYLRFAPAARRALVAASERAALREPAFANLHELILQLPESSCAP
jgi:hypothetical protein